MKNLIVIIDSGINKNHVKMKGIQILLHQNFCDGSDKNDINDSLGHGTAVTSIISSINKNAKYGILKIYQSELVANDSILIESLQYILEHGIESSIIHMSIGVNYLNDELYNICKKIYNNNNILVAAFDNAGCISYPAAFDCVIGVESNDCCNRTTDFLIPINNVVDVYSKGGLHRVAWINDGFALKQGNSFSAAYVTGYIFKNISEKFCKENAMNVLEKVTTFIKYEARTSYDENITLTFHARNIKKAALFPYNKEITSLIRFSDMLSFNVEEVFSNKYFGNMGREVKSFDGSHSYIIGNINNIDYSLIDTLILGHLTEFERFIRRDVKSLILDKCLENDVSVFLLDPYGTFSYPQKFIQKDLMFGYPTLNMSPTKKKFGKLYKIKTPVLGVFGTSSRQGKFTLQLQLRKMFLNHNYTVSQMSSEPTGSLFGIEETIPFGFNNNNALNSLEFINYINNAMYNLDKKNSDIIIVGSQSRTVSEIYNHIGHFSIKQIEFLLGTQPDAVVLCINPDDKIEYIHRTINTIENIFPTKILSLVLYPFLYKNGWHFFNNNLEILSTEEKIKCKAKFEDEFDKRCYLLDDIYDLYLLFEDIINFFS